jgi:hypothetical protein
VIASRQGRSAWVASTITGIPAATAPISRSCSRCWIDPHGPCAQPHHRTPQRGWRRWRAPPPVAPQVRPAVAPERGRWWSCRWRADRSGGDSAAAPNCDLDHRAAVAGVVSQGRGMGCLNWASSMSAAV